MHYIKFYIRINFPKFFFFIKKLKYILSSNFNNSYSYLDNIKNNIALNKEVKIIFDVGANTGNEAILLHNYFPRSKIYCFEPNRKIFSQLKQRLEKFNNIYFDNLFLSSSKQKNYMYLSLNSHLIGSGYKETDVTLNEPMIKTKVRSNSIDEFCKKKKIKTIDILRVDVNGFEKEVLKGAEKLLTKKKIHIIHFSFFNIISKINKAGSLFEITKYLNEKNYRLYALYNNFCHSERRGGYYFATFIT